MVALERINLSWIYSGWMERLRGRSNLNFKQEKKSIYTSPTAAYIRGITTPLKSFSRTYEITQLGLKSRNLKAYSERYSS
jgi:hypothetical protein